MTGQPAPAGVRRRPKDRKQQILAQARDLFLELGYHKVTMGAIASAVGIAPSALYRHFANKAMLLEAVIEESFGAWVLPDEDLPLDQALLEASRLAIARPHALLWSREARHLPAERQRELRTRMRRLSRHYVQLLRRDRPELSEEQADLLAWGFQSVLASPSYGSVRMSSTEHIERLARAAVAIGAVTPSASTGVVRTSDHELCFSPVSRRERLLLAATRLFAVRGYHETSLDDIGAEADVTGPNLYGYFDSKASVLRAVVDRLTVALWLDLQDAMRGRTDPREVLAAVTASYVARRAAEPSLGRQLSGEPEIEEAARANGREYVAEWVALLRATRSDLDQRAARLLVHIALAVADDLTATRHLVTSPGFAVNVTAMVLAVLDS